MNTQLELKHLENSFNNLSEGIDFCSLRFIREKTEELSVRQNVVQPLGNTIDSGVMLTVLHGGGIGYASTSDLSVSGLQAALEIAKDWATA